MRGRAEGPLIGGSLTLVADSLGTPWEIDTRGAILCLEEIGEKPYAIDRQLSHLHAAGKLDVAAGFAIGHLIGCVDAKRARPTALQVVHEILGARQKPLVTGLPIRPREPELAVARGCARAARRREGWSSPCSSPASIRDEVCPHGN